MGDVELSTGPASGLDLGVVWLVFTLRLHAARGTMAAAGFFYYMT